MSLLPNFFYQKKKRLLGSLKLNLNISRNCKLYKRRICFKYIYELNWKSLPKIFQPNKNRFSSYSLFIIIDMDLNYYSKFFNDLCGWKQNWSLGQMMKKILKKLLDVNVIINWLKTGINTALRRIWIIWFLIISFYWCFPLTSRQIFQLSQFHFF